MTDATYSLGIDFGTNSVRTIVVSTRDGEELATAVYNYPTGVDGIVLDDRDPHLARQDPRDYLRGLRSSVGRALKSAAAVKGFAPERVVGIGIDTTGSTPMPVDATCTPLALHDEFAGNPNALAWLWKDHTSRAEAEEITAAAHASRPDYTKFCGGTYSSEWFFAKVLRLARTDPKVFKAAASFVEHCDWMPAVLGGITELAAVKRSVCAAGHKAMFNKAAWGGLPPQRFWSKVDGRLKGLIGKLYSEAHTSDTPAAYLGKEWARALGLRAGIPIGVGAFDAHLGGVGSGIRPGVLVKILGTSTCDMMVVPESEDPGFIPGLCGIVNGSILPHHFGIEAGQSAVGDIFNWVVKQLVPRDVAREAGKNIHGWLIERGLEMKPGGTGLLVLDWHNGNRTVLVDQNLTGQVTGLTLGTRVEEIYRACIEGTAFGARVILERLKEYGLPVRSVVNCGGLAEKNPLLMQIYADVLQVPMKISRSAQTCALGAAMSGAVVGKAHRDFKAAQKAMGGLRDEIYRPKKANVRVYERLFGLYKRLHDGFGTLKHKDNYSDVMKELLQIRAEAIR